MKIRSYMLPLAAVALAAAASTTRAEAQQHVTVTAGEHYDVSGVLRALGGANWRDLWGTPVRVPVLDLRTYAGGLEAEEAGGRQSRTLHFQGADGRRYIFRSTDKFLHGEALPEALRHTPAGNMIQDQISALLPSAGLLVGPLYEAVGLLHPWPTLVVMPDDPALGEFRETYAGMLGVIEENPQEGPDDTPGFAGSSKLVGVDKFLERMDETSEHRPDAAEYLAARLLQFMIADTDRGADQWRFADFPNPSGPGRLWRPVARDHDFAFMLPQGLVGRASTVAYPKLSSFDGTYESLPTLTYMTRAMDRRMLAGLSGEQWDSVVTAMQTQLTDDVFRAVVDRLPGEWKPHAGERLLSGLQGRRAALPEIASEFFRMVSHEADVYATAESERAEIERLSDGSVEVRLYGEGAAGGAPLAVSPSPPAGGVRADATAGAVPYFQRRFMPGETREVRVYMQGGDDVVRVTGRAGESIRVRVLGGGGDDELTDSSTVSKGGWFTRFYTAHGDDRVVRGPNTAIDTRTFAESYPGRPVDIAQRLPPTGTVEPPDDEDEEGEAVAGDTDRQREDAVYRLLRPTYRDWGLESGFGPAADFRSGSGLLIGVGTQYQRYGFRREDYKYLLDGRVLYSLDTGGFGVELFGGYHPENTALGLSLDVSATQFETFRFFGYGNDVEAGGDASARVYRDQVTLRPALFRETETSRVAIGPIFRYGKPNFDEGSPIDEQRPLGVDAFAQAGAAAELRLKRGFHLGADAHGYSLEVGGTAYPALLDVTDAFGGLHGVARAWIPMGRPFLALRAGGRKVWGGFPVHEAAFLGGRTSLRGYETDRFAGDGAVFGSTELHLPLGRIELLVRGDLGVFGLADAGRVFVGDASPGGWHTSYGGGVWFSSLGQMVSLAYATGETGRLYLRLGTPL